MSNGATEMAGHHLATTPVKRWAQLAADHLSKTSGLSPSPIRVVNTKGTKWMVVIDGYDDHPVLIDKLRSIARGYLAALDDMAKAAAGPFEPDQGTNPTPPADPRETIGPASNDRRRELVSVTQTHVFNQQTQQWEEELPPSPPPDMLGPLRDALAGLQAAMPPGSTLALTVHR